MGGGKGNTTQESVVKPWKEAEPYMLKLMQQADQIYNSTGGLNAEYVERELADLDPSFKATLMEMMDTPAFKEMASELSSAGAQGLTGVTTGNQTLSNAASGGLNISADQINQMAAKLYQSDLVDSQVKQLTSDVQTGLAGNLRDLNQQANASGGMGSSRAGVAEGVAHGQAAKAISEGSSQIRSAAMADAMAQAGATLDSNRAAQLSSAEAAGNLGIQSGNLMNSAANIYGTGLQTSSAAGGVYQDYLQSLKDLEYENSYGKANAGWQNLANYYNIVGSMGGQGGSSTLSGSGVSNTNAAIGGAATGAGIGGTIGQGYGAAIGGAIGAIGGVAANSSDPTMKKKIKRTKKGSKTSPAEYSWEWNESAKHHGVIKDGKRVKAEKGRQHGVLAQDAAEKKPEAVSKDNQGRLMVDYDKMPEDAQKGNKGR